MNFCLENHRNRYSRFLGCQKSLIFVHIAIIGEVEVNGRKPKPSTKRCERLKDANGLKKKDYQ